MSFNTLNFEQAVRILQSGERYRPFTQLDAAEWLIENGENQKALVFLRKALGGESDFLRYESIRALGEAKDIFSVEALCTIVANTGSHWTTRCEAARSLGKIGSLQATNPLLVVLTERQEAEKWFNSEKLGLSEYSLKYLQDIKRDEDHVRGDVALALGAIKDPFAITTLIKIALDKTENDGTGSKAAEALGEFKNQKSRKVLEQIVLDKEFCKHTRWSAAEALGKQRFEESVPALLHVLYDLDEPDIGYF